MILNNTLLYLQTTFEHIHHWGGFTWQLMRTDAETHNQNTGWSLGKYTEVEGRLQEPEGSRTLQENPQSQRLNQQPGIIHGSDLGSLHICYVCVAWCFAGLLRVGAGTVSESFAPFWDPVAPTVLPFPDLMCLCVGCLVLLQLDTPCLLCNLRGLLFYDGNRGSTLLTLLENLTSLE